MTDATAREYSAARVLQQQLGCDFDKALRIVRLAGEIRKAQVERARGVIPGPLLRDPDDT